MVLYKEYCRVSPVMWHCLAFQWMAPGAIWPLNRSQVAGYLLSALNEGCCRARLRADREQEGVSNARSS